MEKPQYFVVLKWLSDDILSDPSTEIYDELKSSDNLQAVSLVHKPEKMKK